MILACGAVAWSQSIKVDALVFTGDCSLAWLGKLTYVDAAASARRQPGLSPNQSALLLNWTRFSRASQPFWAPRGLWGWAPSCPQSHAGEMFSRRRGFWRAKGVLASALAHPSRQKELLGAHLAAPGCSLQLCQPLVWQHRREAREARTPPLLGW